ncbi:hypothetical protein POVWA2_041240 [Plasmodium ovale wallikeri]|uniref:Uncharacterized protein n=1 Tax=Plasmodium ovale wallikeri TaxID=864142 RepID=A0A1A8ZBD0_PLAOA|nr:hypothetical protein POVWA2_041240 [Plasmodium ovale wallikeri]
MDMGGGAGEGAYTNGCQGRNTLDAYICACNSNPSKVAFTFCVKIHSLFPPPGVYNDLFEYQTFVAFSVYCQCTRYVNALRIRFVYTLFIRIRCADMFCGYVFSIYDLSYTYCSDALNDNLFHASTKMHKFLSTKKPYFLVLPL